MSSKLPTMRHSGGMSLIELMTVMAVVAIISTIAVSSYRRYLLRANRTEATTTLLQIQVAQEKRFLQFNGYATSNALLSDTLANGGLGIPATTTGGRYNVTLAGTATTYTATATATGPQTQDTTCLTFTINELGMRTPDVASACWR